VFVAFLFEHEQHTLSIPHRRNVSRDF
jgi:hypothetical protein